MDEGCVEHKNLGESTKLSRYSPDTICGPCRERERDAQVGSTEGHVPLRKGVDRAPEAPLEPGGNQVSNDNSTGERLQPTGSPTEASDLSVKIYYRGDSPSEARWQQLCEQHGKDPDAEAIQVWESDEPNESSRDMTTACGKLGVGISGYALVCEECWEHVQSGEPTRICEPWDEDPAPLQERYAGLLRAARVLINAGITKEDYVIPTLVWAAKSWELGQLEEITNRFAEAGEGTELWSELKRRLAGASIGLEPMRVVDGVLLLRWVPVTVVCIPNEETGAIDRITIDVRLRSVKPENVGEVYGNCLRLKDIPDDATQYSIEHAAFSGDLRLSVRPETPCAYPMGVAPMRVHYEQRPFPPSRIIANSYRDLKGSRNKGEGFSFTLPGRERGSGPQGNMIPAVCAWFLGRRGELLSQPALRPQVARLLNRDLLGPCGKEKLPEQNWTPANTIWRTVESLQPPILRAEHAIREHRLSLAFYL